MQEMLKNAVKRGTGSSLYSPYFSIAGKTGTAQTEYWMDDWSSNRRYISSFAGYFPADNPKYSCIVVIHKPDNRIGYYGADVSGPVFKKIAQKIYTDSPVLDSFDRIDSIHPKVEEAYERFFATSRQVKQVMPDLKGLPAMDAVSLLENLGLRVQLSGA